MAIKKLDLGPVEGKQGEPGKAATIKVGTVTNGSSAAVTNSGTENAAVLNFTLPTGAKGSIWYQGTAITGTSTTAKIFSGSGITNARVDDCYLNTSTGNTYKCTIAGNAATAQWVYTGNIKGAKGDKITIPYQEAQPTGQVAGDYWYKIKDTAKKIFGIYRATSATAYTELYPATIASAVTGTDGKTLETKVGAIKGLATSLDSVTESGFAADAKATKDKIDTLNSKTTLQYVANINFNDARNGYFVFDNGSIQNAPSGVTNGFLVQSQGEVAGLIMLFQIVVPGTSVGIYTRVCWYGNWSSWTPI